MVFKFIDADHQTHFMECAHRDHAPKAEQALETAHRMADAIPFGQPVLVGHYSEGRDRRYRDRIGANMDRGLEHARKADDMAYRAKNIRAAAEGAVYSDDPDAIERLEERIADLEAERDRIKAFNMSCRKGAPDPSLLDERWRVVLAYATTYCPAQLGKGGAMPAYVLANLSGNIARQRQRLEALRAERP